MELAKHRWLIYLEALLFVILGIIGIAVPQLFTLAVSLLVGALFFAAGIIQFIHLFQTRDTPGFWGPLVGAILNLALGLLFLFNPLLGIFTLTILLIGYFIIDGLSKIYYSMQLKAFENWGWILLSGILSLILAVLLIIGWPGTATWAIGLLVGINMLFFGIALFGLGYSIPKE